MAWNPRVEIPGNLIQHDFPCHVCETWLMRHIENMPVLIVENVTGN